MPVAVHILFFAKAREIVGKTETKFLTDSPIKYSDLLKLIVDEYSLNEIQNNVILSVNEEYCDAESILTLKQGDEIAVIPPLSGG
nr:unnamed protein product [Callosobruchus chinensis]